MIDRLTLLGLTLVLIWVGTKVIYVVGFRSLLEAVGSQTRLGRLLFHLLMAPGTIVHETSHWLACKVLLVHVREFAPYRPQLDGTLGWVLHDRVGPIRGLVIAIAPLIGGSAAIALAAQLLGGPVNEALASRGREGLVVDLLAWLPSLVTASDWGDWRTWAFVVLAASVCRGLAPSPSDIAPVTATIAALLFGLLVGLAALSWGPSELAGALRELRSQLEVTAYLDRTLAVLSVAASAAIVGGVAASIVGLLSRVASGTVMTKFAPRETRRRR